MNETNWTPQPGDEVLVVENKPISAMTWRSTVQEDGSYRSKKYVDRGKATVELVRAAGESESR